MLSNNAWIYKVHSHNINVISDSLYPCTELIFISWFFRMYLVLKHVLCYFEMTYSTFVAIKAILWRTSTRQEQQRQHQQRCTRLEQLYYLLQRRTIDLWRKLEKYAKRQSQITARTCPQWITHQLKGKLPAVNIKRPKWRVKIP